MRKEQSKQVQQTEGRGESTEISWSRKSPGWQVYNSPVWTRSVKLAGAQEKHEKQARLSSQVPWSSGQATGESKKSKSVFPKWALQVFSSSQVNRLMPSEEIWGFSLSSIVTSVSFGTRQFHWIETVLCSVTLVRHPQRIWLNTRKRVVSGPTLWHSR